MGRIACTNKCAQKKQPALSESCISAYGAIAACSAKGCKMACMMDGRSEKCAKCTQQKCSPAFYKSTGLKQFPKSKASPAAAGAEPGGSGGSSRLLSLLLLLAVFAVGFVLGRRTKARPLADRYDRRAFVPRWRYDRPVAYSKKD
jgi:hypothetical protein